MALTLINVADTLPGGTEFPGTPQQLLDLIAEYLSITGGETFITINFGSATPDADHRVYPWFKTDVAGVPIGWFSWNGSAWQQMPVTVINGNTASRPAGSAGMLYFDTDIQCLLMYNGGWKTAAGNSGDVKFVRHCYAAGSLITDPTINQVLTANPGWTQYTASAARVLGAAGSISGLTPRTLGETVGAEEVVLSEAQLPAHTHQVVGSLDMQADGNAVNPAGILAGSANTNSGSTGDDEAHPNMQPSIFLWCIIKS